MKPIEAADVGVMMAFAQKVIIVPGYGMAVARHSTRCGTDAAPRRSGRDGEIRHHPVAAACPGI